MRVRVRIQSNNPRSVLRCLPAVRVLLLNIGTNFAPEHLEEMFEDPRPGIRRMEMRFRPYVEQASYYQFLKGASAQPGLAWLAAPCSLPSAPSRSALPSQRCISLTWHVAATLHTLSLYDSLAAMSPRSLCRVILRHGHRDAHASLARDTLLHPPLHCPGPASPRHCPSHRRDHRGQLGSPFCGRLGRSFRHEQRPHHSRQLGRQRDG